ncbi:MAG: GntR family transcriptional regulator [Bacteroidota bacterium]
MVENGLKFHLNENSSQPKYKQIVNGVIEDIESGSISTGYQLPSITQLSIDYLVSRDTVEKAYKNLREQGIIESVIGKGFYVTASSPKSKLRVFVLFNKLSAYKKVIFNTLAYELRDKATLELFIYHCNLDLFESYINDKVGRYNYYLIMSHFDTPDKQRIANAINKIRPEKLILIDNIVEGVGDFRGAVYQDFKNDIYNALVEADVVLRKYDKLVLVFPTEVPYPYPKHIMEGFKRFCAFHDHKYEVVDEISTDYQIDKGSAYLIVEENDLANLIKLMRQQGLTLTKDIGILSYNETPLKEVLLEGISVMTTDFAKLGVTASKMIMNEIEGEVKNDFKLILRSSL